jgi:CheY-like chemotaxis protein
MVIYAQPAELLEELSDETAPEAPAEHTSAEGDARSTPSHGEEEHRRTVLIIEDDPDFRRMLIASLKLRFGYRVLYATEGLAGIRMVAREQPDLILMDLAMPGMDGLVATRMLKRHPSTAHIPVVAFSNYGRISTWQRMALDAGCVQCLDKSLRLQELYETIEELLGRN